MSRRSLLTILSDLSEDRRVQYSMLCFSSICFYFLEEFLEKEEAEGVEGLLVNLPPQPTPSLGIPPGSRSRD